MEREVQWNELSNRKRKCVEDDNFGDNTQGDSEDSDEEAEIENFMLAMACGNTIGNEELQRWIREVKQENM